MMLENLKILICLVLIGCSTLPNNEEDFLFISDNINYYEVLENLKRHPDEVAKIHGFIILKFRTSYGHKLLYFSGRTLRLVKMRNFYD